MSLEQSLRDFFGVGDKRVVVMGVGSLNGDDKIGPRIIELLNSKPLRDVLLINAESAPESFTGKVEKFNPTHVLIVDAADFHGAPGDTKLISKDEIGGQAISTHTLPLNLFMYYIENSMSLPIIVLGVQPLSIAFWAPLSEPLEAAGVSITNTLYQVLSE
jgi:hydrogenase 3 maturation protease